MSLCCAPLNDITVFYFVNNNQPGTLCKTDPVFVSNIPTLLITEHQTVNGAVKITTLTSKYLSQNNNIVINVIILSTVAKEKSLKQENIHDCDFRNQTQCFHVTRETSCLKHWFLVR
jgi:hypothetical protein